MNEPRDRLAAGTMALVDIASESRDEAAILDTSDRDWPARPGFHSSTTATPCSRPFRHDGRPRRWFCSPGTSTPSRLAGAPPGRHVARARRCAGGGRPT